MSWQIVAGLMFVGLAIFQFYRLLSNLLRGAIPAAQKGQETQVLSKDDAPQAFWIFIAQQGFVGICWLTFGVFVGFGWFP